MVDKITLVKELRTKLPYISHVPAAVDGLTTITIHNGWDLKEAKDFVEKVMKHGAGEYHKDPEAFKKAYGPVGDGEIAVDTRVTCYKGTKGCSLSIAHSWCRAY